MRSMALIVVMTIAGLSTPADVKAGCDTTLVKFEPENIPVPDGLDSHDVVISIMRAFVMRTWRVTEVNRRDGYVDAELPIRSHVGRVRARIDARSISFHHREGHDLPHGWEEVVYDSRGEECRQVANRKPEPSANELVHRNYRAWVDDVARTPDGVLRLKVEAD